MPSPPRVNRFPSDRIVAYCLDDEVADRAGPKLGRLIHAVPTPHRNLRSSG